jgi:predicted ArsR family transcriptional regulator
MDQAALQDDLLALLKLIREEGSSVCAGTCEHSKPYELHCHRASYVLKISSSGFKRRLRELVDMGLLKKERVKRDEDGKVVGRWTLTEEGCKYLN